MKSMFPLCSVAICLLLALSLGGCVVSPGGVNTDQRFSRSADGVITDLQTNLQWLLGPGKMNYDEAVRWVAAQKTVAGGGWRMPTRVEVLALYDAYKKDHISPAFRTSFSFFTAWAETYKCSDSRRPQAWYVHFQNGSAHCYPTSTALGVLAVRSSK